MSVSPDGRWIAVLGRPEPDAPLRRRHQPAAAQLRRRPACRGRAGVHVRGVQPRQQRSSPSSCEPWSPPSRCACWTRTPCSRRRSSPSPAASRSGASTSSSAPTVATWPPPCTRSTGRGRIASEAPGYAVVWDLRSPSTPPVRVPTGTDAPGAGAQPGRPDPVHRLAADGVRRGDGQADLAARGRHVGTWLST